jgi:hypothetical protein
MIFHSNLRPGLLEVFWRQTAFQWREEQIARQPGILARHGKVPAATEAPCLFSKRRV